MHRWSVVKQCTDVVKQCFWNAESNFSLTGATNFPSMSARIEVHKGRNQPKYMCAESKCWKSLLCKFLATDAIYRINGNTCYQENSRGAFCTGKIFMVIIFDWGSKMYSLSSTPIPWLMISRSLIMVGMQHADVGKRTNLWQCWKCHFSHPGVIPR